MAISDPPGSANAGSSQRHEAAPVGVLGFARRHWRLLCGVPLAAGLATAAVILLAVPRTYEASATLVVVPPKFASDLKPSTLTVQGYQKLLESDAAIAETKNRLVQQGILGPEAPLRLHREVESGIFVSRRPDEPSPAPMIQAVARGRSPQQAAAIANTWAEVFLERTKSLTLGSTSATVQFIDQQFPQVRAELAGLEDRRVAASNGYQRKQDNAATRWDENMGAYRKETAEAVAVYKAETRRLVEESTSRDDLETRHVQLLALRQAYSDLQGEQVRVAGLLQQKQLQADAARKHLAATPQFLVLQKAIVDEAVLRALADAKENKPDLGRLQDKRLATQEINPVYTELAARLLQIDIELNALLVRPAKITQDLAAMNEEIKAKDAPLRLDEAALEKLERMREAGLAKIEEDRSNGLAALTRRRQLDLDSIKREWDAKVGELDRDVDNEKELFNEVAKHYRQVLLAKAQQDVEDVRLGAAAVPTDRPQPRGTVGKSLLAVLIGAILAVLIAIVRDAAAAAGEA